MNFLSLRGQVSQMHCSVFPEWLHSLVNRIFFLGLQDAWCVLTSSTGHHDMWSTGSTFSWATFWYIMMWGFDKVPGTYRVVTHLEISGKPRTSSFKALYKICISSYSQAGRCHIHATQTFLFEFGRFSIMVTCFCWIPLQDNLGLMHWSYNRSLNS